MLDYLAKYHRWITGTLVAIIIPLFIYGLQKKDAAPRETKIFYYANLQGEIGDRDLKGVDCWTASISSNRSDAFRCSANGGIYDPCFEDVMSKGDVVTCPGEPYEKKPESFRVISKPEYDPKIESEGADPWYIILKNGQTCRFITGATAVIANRRLDYGCSKGTYDSLYLPLKKEGKELEIGCSTQDRIQYCSIEEVWY